LRRYFIFNKKKCRIYAVFGVSQSLIRNKEERRKTMICPEWGRELEKGIIEAKDAGSLTQSLTMVLWYPEEYKNKMFKKNTVNLRLKAEGYYCDECMKVFASFEEK